MYIHKSVNAGLAPIDERSRHANATKLHVIRPKTAALHRLFIPVVKTAICLQMTYSIDAC